MEQYASATGIRYETPFADITVREEGVESESPDYISNLLRETLDSPFSRTFDTSPSQPGLTVAHEEFVDLLAELNQQDFTNTLYNMASEIEDTWRSKISGEALVGNFSPYATQQARDYINVVSRETDTMINNLLQQFTGFMQDETSEQNFETIFSELTFSNDHLTPAQEEFLGGVFNKVKAIAKKGLDLAKKGVAAVGKILPINIVLNKLKGLIRPLLDKVLKFAIGKLPKNLQPHAQTLAKKFLNLETTEQSYNGNVNNETMGSLDGIQTELNTSMAQLAFVSEEVEADRLVDEYANSFETVEQAASYEIASLPTIPDLSDARQKFINELKELPPGENPAPAIERFLPAAILALQPIIKIAIGIIGRPKVVNFIAGLLAKLVSKYVPANVAQPLAASIVDVGMSAIGFEIAEREQPDLGYEAIANTIQDTVQELNGLNEETIADPNALAAQFIQSFETAVANNFPAQYIKPELRRTKHSGVWVLMPRNGCPHLYKKFSRVFETTIDPQTASNLKTYRGLPLAKFLRDKLGLDPSKPIQAKVHVYQAINGTTLARVAKSEKLPGLNANQPYAWSQFHPLTSQAATLLLKEPALGKWVEQKGMHKRYLLCLGQRFYYLEIAGARLRIPPVNRTTPKPTGTKPAEHTGTKPSEPVGMKPLIAPKPSQSSDIQGVINFLKAEIKFNYYFSEEDAKDIVERMNKNDNLGAAITIKKAVSEVLHNTLLKNVGTKVKIVHEAILSQYLDDEFPVTQDQFTPRMESFGAEIGKAVITKIIEKLIEKLIDVAYQAVSNYFKARGAEFKEAYAKPADGVTVKIIWSNLPGMPTIRAAINAMRGTFSVGNLTDLVLPTIPTPDIQVFPDKKFD